MRILAIVTCLLLSACGGADDQAEPPAPESADAAQQSVFDPLTDTLERAQGVENTLQESADERRRQLEEAEGR